VPAAAVIRIVQVFNLVTRCIRPQRRCIIFLIKNRDKLFGRLIRCLHLNMVGVKDTLYVKVKFVEI